MLMHRTIGEVLLCENFTCCSQLDPHDRKPNIEKNLMARHFVAIHVEEIHKCMGQCDECKIRTPQPPTTLFQVSIAPKWSKYLIEYLPDQTFPKGVSKARKNTIESEENNYAIIGN